VELVIVSERNMQSALLVYPLHAGILVNELVYVVEDELYVLMDVVNNLLGIDLGDLSESMCCE